MAREKMVCIELHLLCIPLAVCIADTSPAFMEKSSSLALPVAASEGPCDRKGLSVAGAGFGLKCCMRGKGRHATCLLLLVFFAVFRSLEWVAHCITSQSG